MKRIIRQSMRLSAPAIVLAIAFALAGCNALPLKTEPRKLPVKAQEEKAIEELNQMLEATAELPREETREVIEKGYHNIIKNYPDSDIAEESYYRLITLNIRDFEVPREEEAERLYREYFERYPNARLTRPVNFTMARYYYEFGRWEKLSDFCMPYVKVLIETGSMDNSLCMFYYSEANLNLKNFDEALRGYVTYLQHYPAAAMAPLSRARMETIRKLKSGQPEAAPHPELPPQQ